MDKKLFLLAAAGVLLAGMKKSTTSGNGGGGGESTGGGTGGGNGAGAGSPGAGIDAGAVIKGAISAGTAIAGALGIGTAGATGTGAAAGAGAAGTAGTAGTGSLATTHVTFGTTMSTATGGGGAAGGAAGTGAVAGGIVASAAFIAVAIIVVVIIIAAIITFSIVGANLPLKHAIGMMSRNNGIDLHKFELAVFQVMRDNLNMVGGFQQVDVADQRLNGMPYGTLPTIQAGAPISFNGQRATFAYRPAPGAKADWMAGDSAAVAVLRMFKQIRALSLEYLTFRSHLLDNMGHGFYPDIYPPNFATTNLDASFAAQQWGQRDWGPPPPADLGGLSQLPLLDGQTLYSVDHPESLSYGRPSGYAQQNWGPREWFIARNADPDTSFLATPYGDQLLKASRLRALCDVVSLFAIDPTVVFAWEGYMQFVVQRLGLGSDQVTIRSATAQEPWNGWTFYTNPSFFGTAVAFDVWMIRVPSGNSRMFKRNAGVPLGDKRLGATWIE